MEAPACALVRIPSGRTRVLELPSCRHECATESVYRQLEVLEGLPRSAIYLVGDAEGVGMLEARIRLVGGGGDQPDWTELGKVPTGGKRRVGPDSRAPDWHADPAKYAAKIERDKRERGELVVAVGPFCVPCGKRFAKQTVYDAHLSGKKHLAALQRMGREEEAMVCQLDIEAKRRKLQAAEEARYAALAPPTKGGASASAEDAAAAAARHAAREEKLRERAMLPMPTTVSASSVYADGADEKSEEDAPEAESATGGDAAATTTVSSVAEQVNLDPARQAHAASGTSMSYTSGVQDGGEQRTNRHTTSALAAQHRALAVAPADWFNPQPRQGAP